MKVSHVAGGGVGVLAGAVVLAVCNHFGIHVTDVDATIIGSAAISAGAGVGHACAKLGAIISKVGIIGAVKQFLRGTPTDPTAVA